MAAPPSDTPEFHGRRVHGDLEEVVKFSYASRDAGERSWGRLAGTRWAEQTVNYVAGEFRAAGLVDIVKLEVPFQGVDQTVSAWQVSLLGLPEFGAGSTDLELKSAFPMSQRPEGPGLPGKRAAAHDHLVCDGAPGVRGRRHGGGPRGQERPRQDRRDAGGPPRASFTPMPRVCPSNWSTREPPASS